MATGELSQGQLQNKAHIKARGYGERIETSRSLPPLLADERLILNRYSMEVAGSSLAGCLAGVWITKRNFNQVKNFFQNRIRMGDYWWIGQFNVVLLTGFIAGQVCNQNRKEYWFSSLPEGYYRYGIIFRNTRKYLRWY